MKGLELSRKYYNEFGECMLQAEFSHLLPFLAVGLAGSGSECYGYDDDISHDHDFEPAFCIFIPDENVIDSKAAFALERAYAKLPDEFCGCKRCKVSAVGGNRHGVIRMGDFFETKTGKRDGALTLADWLNVPEHALAEAVNGAVFFDNYGEFTKIRERIAYLPEDVRTKKLAGHLLLMAQAGQYNYNRCISRGDTAAAQLAVYEFVKSAIHAVFLINKAYMPYYKWQFKALKGLPRLCGLANKLEYLISSDNSATTAERKAAVIEEICAAISKELGAKSAELEPLAYEINNKISDGVLRNMHILCAV